MRLVEAVAARVVIPSAVGLASPLDVLVTLSVFPLIHDSPRCDCKKQKGGHLAALVARNVRTGHRKFQTLSSLTRSTQPLTLFVQDCSSRASARAGPRPTLRETPRIVREDD